MPKSKIETPVSENRLLQLLGEFSLTELKRFRDYIAKSYLSNQTLLLELLDNLMPLLGKEDSNLKKGNNILKLLMTTARFGVSPYRAVFKDLLRLAQNYIEKQGYRDKPEKAVGDVLKAVNAKRLDKLFDINLSLAQRVQSMVSNRSADYHIRDFMIQTEQPFHQLLQDSHTAHTAPNELMNEWDVLYLVNKLRFACTQYQHKNANKVLLDPILKEAADGEYSTIPAVKVYYTIYLMLDEPNEASHFELLKKLLKAQQSQLAEPILRDSYVFAINYCVSQINKGKMNYLRDVYELYTTALDRQFLYDGQELEAWDISKIMTLSTQLRNYQWSDKFIELYKERAPYSGEMNVFTFNLAKMYFFSKRYDEVLKLLANIENKNPMYLLGTHILLIQCYYQLDDSVALNKAIGQFKILLKRRKNIEAAEKARSLQFIETLSAILKIPKTQKKNRRAMLNSIGDNNSTAEAEWLRAIV